MNESLALEIVSDKPQELMRRATDVAGICKEIVLKTAVQIQGRKYVRCEGWMSIATAHGCIASSKDVKKVDGGWTAIGEIKRISDGVVLSTAEGFVGTGEKRWGAADEYACRAMAQTRAISRACRAAFAHVVVLMDAGLSTTPAEEVPEGGFDDSKAHKPQTTISMPSVKQNPAQVKPEPPKAATAVTRAAMMEFLMANSVTEQDILGYGIDKAVIMPNEGLVDWPLDRVGTSKTAWKELLAAVKRWRDGDLATPVAVPRDPEVGEDAEWRSFPVPFGNNAGTMLGKLAKGTLFGFWDNFKVETEYNGRPKKPETIAKDTKFREMLDAAGIHYEFTKPDDDDTIP